MFSLEKGAFCQKSVVDCVSQLLKLSQGFLNGLFG